MRPCPFFVSERQAEPRHDDGDKTTIRASINMLPRETLLVENASTRNVINLPGEPTYVTNVRSTRVSSRSRRRSSSKAFVQYTDDRRLANVNLLLWSVYRPGSDLYVVYNEGSTPPGARAPRTRNRLLSVKMSYWLSR